MCNIDLGSKGTLKSQFDLGIRISRDREVAQPQGGRGSALGGIRAILFLVERKKRSRW
jgi:hypothetical protein